MNVLRLAAFSDGDQGGNPAGVVISDDMPDKSVMQALAQSVGYSETAFAARSACGWRVRYFSPEAEVPFCGHATIALGAALAMRFGDGSFDLQLNDGGIRVSGRRDGALVSAVLDSPPTRSSTLESQEVEVALSLFGLLPTDLDERLPPARIHAGADHLALAVHSRAILAGMRYDFARGQLLARERGWVTMLLAYAESPTRFHVRNAFAYGGVYEDPATGAAAAAWAGYLRDLAWPHGGSISLLQGDDMGVPCRLFADLPNGPGTSIRISGMARLL